MKSKLKPKRTDLGYLIGWFKVATKGNYRLAASMARDYQRKGE